MRILSAFVLLFALALVGVSCTRNEATTQAQASTAADKCEHGVKKALCTRCNPKLEAAFKVKGDWCEEHKRPESQCLLCKPELAEEGLK